MEVPEISDSPFLAQNVQHFYEKQTVAFAVRGVRVDACVWGGSALMEERFELLGRGIFPQV